MILMPGRYNAAYFEHYSWQIWETNAFSLYTTGTDHIDREGAQLGLEAILSFMTRRGMLKDGFVNRLESQVVEDVDMVTARAGKAGIFERYVRTGQTVQKGQLLARILCPYDGEVLEEIVAPVKGTVFFASDQPLTYSSTAVFKIIP